LLKFNTTKSVTIATVAPNMMRINASLFAEFLLAMMFCGETTKGANCLRGSKIIFHAPLTQ
jgi:hypothetical protein